MEYVISIGLIVLSAIGTYTLISKLSKAIARVVLKIKEKKKK